MASLMVHVLMARVGWGSCPSIGAGSGPATGGVWFPALKLTTTLWLLPFSCQRRNDDG